MKRTSEGVKVAGTPSRPVVSCAPSARPPRRPPAAPPPRAPQLQRAWLGRPASRYPRRPAASCREHGLVSFGSVGATRVSVEHPMTGGPVGHRGALVLPTASPAPVVSRRTRSSASSDGERGPGERGGGHICHGLVLSLDASTDDLDHAVRGKPMQQGGEWTAPVGKERRRERMASTRLKLSLPTAYSLSSLHLVWSLQTTALCCRGLRTPAPSNSVAYKGRGSATNNQAGGRRRL